MITARMRGIRLLRSSRSLILSITSTISAIANRGRLIERASHITESTPDFSVYSSSFSTSGFELRSENLISRSGEEIYSKNDNDDDDDDNEGSDGDDDDDDDDNQKNIEDGSVKKIGLQNESLVRDVNVIVDILRNLGGNGVEMKNKLEQCGVRATIELVDEILSRVRNDWEAAFTFFLWAGKQPDYKHSVREYHSMISILAKMRKFDTAWSLIDEMRGRKTGMPLVTQQTLLIMIRRYCAVHDVARAINTFYAYKQYQFDVGMNEFHSLLSALCRYKNVKDAEYLIFCNKDVYPFNSKSFNIVLNGWCNIIGSPREAERIWNEMSKRGVRYDVVSYSSIMSCYSKAGNLHKVFKLYEQMKRMGIVADRKVYNALIHALAKGRLIKEAINLMKIMKEKDIAPDIVTYNSLIKPLCKARKIDEAKQVFEQMLERGISPTIRTYHAFFRMLRTGEEVFDLLDKMREMGCQPTNDTYIMLIRKFCRWRQSDNVFKVWDEISENGLSPDRSSYIVLIHGLVLNGNLEEAYKFYKEMKEKELLLEPKLDEMIQYWLANKQITDCEIKEKNYSQSACDELGKQTRVIRRNVGRRNGCLQQPEIRKVVRERGFSFWDT